MAIGDKFHVFWNDRLQLFV